MSYFDHLDFADMAKNPTQYFENKKVVNFDIIHHECRGDPLNGSYKDYQTVKSKDLKIYPNIKKKRVWVVLFETLNKTIYLLIETL